MLEIKEAERPDLAVDRVAALLDATGAADRVIVISFDHVVLKRAVERHPGLRTEAITHARHADLVGVLRACGASSVSIELDMFHPDDAKALHDAGLSNRVHLPRPEALAECWRGGRDIVPRVVEWIAEGLIDTISGDDVPVHRRARRTRRPGGGHDDALSPAELDHRLRVAEAVVRDAGRLAAEHFARRELLSIDRKGAQDLVSEADRACEDLIVARPWPRRFPDDGFLGEERGSRNPDAAAIWVIDPIDGTHNFLTGSLSGACR